ncbi:hypothetical protein [Natrialba sp. SSL1]|uniref:hypothetical protein n=1 Tax=Natrialba sp. SSL1 TaxID=1869245 RepID=UPI0009FBE0CF|nr:hypothetical protein [Natrialba sp. SSL1]
MVSIQNLGHPAVEIKLPLDNGTHQYGVPKDTTLFLWATVAVGTPECIPQIDSSLGHHLFRDGVEAQDQMNWSVSVGSESVPLLTDSYYRNSGYKGLAWWIAVDSVELPAAVDVEFETVGDQPTHQGDPITLWTEQGDMLSWGQTIESTIELNSSNSPARSFPTHQESLWEEHAVYRPQSNTE